MGNPFPTGGQMLFLALLLMALGGAFVKGCDFACSRYTVKIEKVSKP
jgi:hypothetical protein